MYICTYIQYICFSHPGSFNNAIPLTKSTLLLLYKNSDCFFSKASGRNKELILIGHFIGQNSRIPSTLPWESCGTGITLLGIHGKNPNSSRDLVPVIVAKVCLKLIVFWLRVTSNKRRS